MRVPEPVARTVVGTAIGLAVAAALFLPRGFLLGLVLVWVALASWEFGLIVARRGLPYHRGLGIAVNLAVPLAVYFQVPGWWLLAPLFVIAIWAVLAHQTEALTFTAVTTFGAVYLGVLPATLILLQADARLADRSFWHVIFPLLFTWINDTAAYGFGVWLGRHKLALRISPRKSWEGLAASIVFALATVVAYQQLFWPGRPILPFLALGLVMSAGAFWGDLLESSFKRAAQVKDSSQAIPGHGGFLDRVDSLVFTIPTFYCFFHFYLLPRLPLS